MAARRPFPVDCPPVRARLRDAVALGLCVAAVACSDQRRAATILVPVVRVVDRLEPGADPSLAYGSDVVLARERRRAIAAPATVTATARGVRRGPWRGFVVDGVPPEVRDWPT